MARFTTGSNTVKIDGVTTPNSSDSNDTIATKGYVDNHEGTTGIPQVVYTQGDFIAVDTDGGEFLDWSVTTTATLSLNDNQIEVLDNSQGGYQLGFRVADVASNTLFRGGILRVTMGSNTGFYLITDVTIDSSVYDLHISTAIAGVDIFDSISTGDNVRITAFSIVRAGDGINLSHENEISIDLDGNTLQLGADGLSIHPLGVDTTELADAAVTSAKIDNNAITTTAISNDAVTYPKIDQAGTAGQVLTVNSAGNNWEWTTLAGAAAEVIDYTTTVAIPDNNLVAYEDNLYLALQAFSAAAAWSSTTSYAVGDQAAHSNVRWIALIANTNSAPSDSNANWYPLTPAYQNDYWSQVNDDVYGEKPLIEDQRYSFTKRADGNTTSNGQFGYGTSTDSRRLLIRASGGSYSRAERVADYWNQGAQLTVEYTNPSDPVDGNNGTYHYRLGNNTSIDTSNNWFETDLGDLVFNSNGDNTDILRSSGNLTGGYTFTVTTLGDNTITEIGELNDVSISSVADNQFLRYNSTNERWENETVDFTVYTAGDGILISNADAISVDYDNSDDSVAVASKQYARTEFVEDLSYTALTYDTIRTISGHQTTSDELLLSSRSDGYLFAFGPPSNNQDFTDSDHWEYLRVTIGGNTRYYKLVKVLVIGELVYSKNPISGSDILSGVSDNTTVSLAFTEGSGSIGLFSETTDGIVPRTGTGQNTDDYVLYGNGEWAEPYAVYNPQTGYTAPRATGNDGLAAGHTALASGASSVALGLGTDATAFHTTAIGAGAQATSNNSTALGYNAATTAGNQVMLGGGQQVVTPDGYTPQTSQALATKGYVDSHPGVVHYVDTAHPSEIAYVGNLTDDIVYNLNPSDTSRIGITIDFHTSGYYNFPVDTNLTLDGDYFAEVVTTHGNVEGVIFQYTGDTAGTVTFPSNYTFNYSLALNGYAIDTSHITVAWDLVVWSDSNPDTSLSDFNGGTLLASTGASGNISGAVNTTHTGALTMTPSTSKLTVNNGDFIGLRFHIRMGNGQAYNLPSNAADRWVMTHQTTAAGLTTRVVHVDPSHSLSIANNGVVTWSDLEADPSITTTIIDDAGTIPTNAIKDMAITTAKLDDLGVTTGKLAADAVTQAKIGPSAVGTTELADEAVETAKLNDGAVSNAKLSDDSVSYAKIDVSGTAGQVLTLNSAGTNWEWADSSSEAYLDISPASGSELPQARGGSSNAIAIGPGAETAPDGSVNNNAIAIGHDAKVIASDSASAMAIGRSAEVDGINSFAFGNNSGAYGNESIAIGDDANAGVSSTDQAVGALALGSGTDATGDRAVAIGLHSQASGDQSVAIGGGSTDSQAAGAAGAQSVAIGHNSSASATATNSVAIGAGVNVSASNQVLIGSSTHTVHLGRETTSADTNVAVATKGYVDTEVGGVLPSFTSAADSSKVLTVDSTGDTVSFLDIPDQLPSFTSADDSGKVLTVDNSGDTVSFADVPDELPTYTSADNAGQVLTVSTQGNTVSWQTPADTVDIRQWSTTSAYAINDFVVEGSGDSKHLFQANVAIPTCFAYNAAATYVVDATNSLGYAAHNNRRWLALEAGTGSTLGEPSLTNTSWADVTPGADVSGSDQWDRIGVADGANLSFNDTTSSGATIGADFTVSGTNVSATIDAGDIALQHLSNVSTETPTAGEFLQWNETNSNWAPTTLNVTPSDVDVGSDTPSANQVLSYVSGTEFAWVDQPTPGEEYLAINATSGDTAPTATGVRSIAIGPFSNAETSSAIAVGRGASVTSSEGIAIGRGATADNVNSIALGYGANTSVSNELVLGGTTGSTGGISRVRVGLTSSADYDTYANLPNAGFPIKQHLTDNFYTQSHINSNYYTQSQVYTKTESDSRYITPTSPTSVSLTYSGARNGVTDKTIILGSNTLDITYRVVGNVVHLVGEYVGGGSGSTAFVAWDTLEFSGVPGTIQNTSADPVLVGQGIVIRGLTGQDAYGRCDVALVGAELELRYIEADPTWGNRYNNTWKITASWPLT